MLVDGLVAFLDPEFGRDLSVADLRKFIWKTRANTDASEFRPQLCLGRDGRSKLQQEIEVGKCAELEGVVFKGRELGKGHSGRRRLF